MPPSNPPTPARVLDFIAAPDSEAFPGLALDVFAYQFEHNPPYRRFCQARARTPTTVTTWKDVPAVPTLAFKELDLACGPAEKVFLTSGTTRGQQTRGRHPVPDLKLYHASALAHFTACLLPDSASLRILSLIPSPATRPDSSLTQMADWVMRDLGTSDSRYFIDADGIHLDAFAEAVAQAETDGRAVCVLAITSALTAFFDRCAARGRTFALPSGSRIMDTGGNKGDGRPLSRNGYLQSCWKYLKVPGYACVNEYGMTEMASQFYDHVLHNRARNSNEPRYKIGPAWTRTLVVDPETLEEMPHGERGILRHCDLANCGSVMAIQTDDVGYVTGAGFEIVGRTPGAEARGCALTLDEFLAVQ